MLQCAAVMVKPIIIIIACMWHIILTTALYTDHQLMVASYGMKGIIIMLYNNCLSCHTMMPSADGQ